MKEEILSLLESTESFRTLEQRVRALAPGPSASITGLAGSLGALVFAALQEKVGRQLLYVAADRESATRMHDDFTLAARAGNVHLFDAGPRHHGARQEPGADAETISSLRALVTDSVAALVTSPAGLLAALPSPSSVKGRPFPVTAGETLSHADFLGKLQELGFQKKDFVEERGDYAVRGGIVDVYPFVGDNPVRMEFSADEIGSLREFDPASQRSIKELATAVLVPDLLAGGDGKSSSLLDYLAPDAVVILEEPERLTAELTPVDSGFGATEEDSPAGLLEMFAQIHLHALRQPDSVDLAAQPQPAVNSSIATLRRLIAGQQKAGWRIFVTCDTHSEQLRLRELLGAVRDERPPGELESAEPVDLEAISFSLEALHSGFMIPSLLVAVYTEHQLFNRLKRRGKKRAPRFRGLAEAELHKLHKGDFVVHRDYGIGRFDGLKKITVKNIEQEVVKLLYEEKDTLYVNLNYITKLQKYSSKEGHVPKLTRLGSAEWDRLRLRAKKRVKDIARELIRLYARRKKSEGFPFPPDAPWQKELEASFMYEDTFDQAKATLDVKQDMEARSPMDRLICGDVGFGKTEVAVRAAFKSVMGGKQVAVLVPTTILAEQHVHTFVDRVARYGVSVRAISRFKPKAEQSAILAQLAEGGIDIVIGTHRLLSKDVRFKDLGLLIIDEEHRFGVTSKERLRHLRAEVDTLTLTATPIPRTLHFSLLGARDLSIIATPPRNRLPVQTEITQWNDELIRDAVMRELQRGGQIYFVHDRVQTIEEVSSRLRSILPTVRLRTAHGQMRAHELEEVMLDFLERKFDLLVATKIIESGLDIPNVNTIIINRADRFGMAELYQLRGRVGRSNVQAYAFLLTPPVSVIPKPTLQRLQAVEEFTELGSGFNLAMRDLEIRGAGNLLGSEQSGFIEAMGFETYTRILDEAVQELKDEEFKELFVAEPAAKPREQETVVEADYEALIPDDYLPGEVERLATYRRLYALSTPEQLREIGEELRDRFGVFPRPVENLFQIVSIRLASANMGFRKVNIAEERVSFEFPPEDDTRFYEQQGFQLLMERISRMRRNGLRLEQTGKKLVLHAPLNAEIPEKERLSGIVDLLKSLGGG